MNRREFLKTAAVAGIGLAVGGGPVESGKPRLPKRKLGRTGEKLSIVGMGGIVVTSTEQSEADRIVREAVERGVNYFDVAPTYGNAEERLGPALKPYRDRAFLACKTEKRDKEGAAEALRESLKRLQTDHFDLYQLHALGSAEDVEKALGPDGAIETFKEARDKGTIRYIGFSAHSEEAALMAMERFDFDTILFPFNWACYYKADFGPKIMKAARDRNMGILALKAMARNPWPEGAEREFPKCWYQPVSDSREVELSVRFTLSEPVTAILPPGDARLFTAALPVAEKFKPLTEKEKTELKALASNTTPIFPH